MAVGKFLPVAIAVAGAAGLCVIMYACLIGGMGFCGEEHSNFDGLVEETDVEGVMLVKEARIFDHRGNITFTVDQNWTGVRLDIFPSGAEGTVKLVSGDGLERANLVVSSDSAQKGAVTNLDPAGFYGEAHGEWTLVYELEGGPATIMVFELTDPL